MKGLRDGMGAPIPWKDQAVALIRVRYVPPVPEGSTEAAAPFGGIDVEYANTLKDKQDALASSTDFDIWLVAWPGKVRQDVFVIDDPVAALEWIRRQAGGQ